MDPLSSLLFERVFKAMSIINDLQLGLGRRLPMILQTEAAECGIACLAMIASFMGNQNLTLSALRKQHGFSLKGANLKDLLNVADKINLVSRPVRLELDELKLLKAPCILHWDLNHFVVLKKVTANHIIIHDPNNGVCKLTLAQTSQHFTGVAIELTPGSNFQTAQAAPRVKLRQLLGSFSGVGWSLTQLLCFALALQVFSLVSPLFMQLIVDNALVSADLNLLSLLALGFVILLVVRTAVSVMRSWVLMILSASLKVQARSNLFAHLINLSSSYFDTRHLGDIMSRFESQNTILQTLTTELIEVVLDGLMVSFTLVILFLYDPTLAGIVVIGALFYGLLRWLSYGRLRQLSAESIVWGAKRDTHFLETLRGIKTIKLFNALNNRHAHFSNLMVETINRQLSAKKLKLLIRTLNTLLLGSLAILIIWLGAIRVIESSFSIGMLLAFISYKDQFLSRTSALIDRIVDLQMLKLHGERLADIALTEQETSNNALGAAKDSAQSLTIEVKDVSFRYAQSEPWILEDINFKVNAGEFIAITGKSGGGKSTLLSLLSGLLVPTKGEILINGESIQHINIEQFRNSIGVVMQDDKLFAGSIADNISFFADELDQSHLEKCAKIADIDADIKAMPMGYHTLIGDMGTTLSGGQKQRLIIARSLYKKPAILLLDEATSHLDINCEKSISQSLQSIDITRIAIAHRPETIRSAQRILVLKEGSIKESNQQ